MEQLTETAVRSYEEICEDSRVYVDVGDVAAWKIGDNAIEALSAGATLIDYAKDIGKPKGTISEYRKMSAYFDATARAELFDACPNITRSHMRKVLSIKDRMQGRAFVEHCSMRGWTVDQFGYILKRYKRMAGLGARPTPPKAERREFDALLLPGHRGHVSMMTDAWDQISAIAEQHPDARITVVVEYTPTETRTP